MGRSFTIAAVPRQRSHSQVRFPRLMTIFYCLRFETPPKLEGQAPVFISPRKRVSRLYPPGIGFPFRRLLRLTGLRCRYSTPPPHGRSSPWSLSAIFITLNSVRTSQKTHCTSIRNISGKVIFKKTPFSLIIIRNK
jgi:hypothetical protein